MEKVNFNLSALEGIRGIYDLFTFLYNAEEKTITETISYDDIIRTTNNFTDYVLRNKKGILNKNIKLPFEYSCTCLHSINVMIYAILFCKELNIDENKIYIIARAAFLHDIGKRYIPDSIISKNGRLSTEEFEIIKSHPLLGYMFIINLYPNVEREVKEVILLHHGLLHKQGYPLNYVSSGIPLPVQIISIIDKFEAYTGERSYHKGRTLRDGLDFIKKEPGLNKKYVKVFVHMLKDVNTCFNVNEDIFVYR